MWAVDLLAHSHPSYPLPPPHTHTVSVPHLLSVVMALCMPPCLSRFGASGVDGTSSSRVSWMANDAAGAWINVHFFHFSGEQFMVSFTNPRRKPAKEARQTEARGLGGPLQYRQSEFRAHPLSCEQTPCRTRHMEEPATSRKRLSIFCWERV